MARRCRAEVVKVEAAEGDPFRDHGVGESKGLLYAFLHTSTSTHEEVQAFCDRLLARVPGGIDPAHISVGLIGASTGPHLGPHLMGAAFLRRR